MKITFLLKLKIPQKKSIPLLFLLFLFATLHAQDITVTGNVTDGATPLPGVNVLVKSTTNGTQTNFDGNFTLNNVPVNSILVFSFVGFEVQEITVKDNSPINISLKEDAQSLEEVVVVGYGTQRKSDLTGAISTITSDEIAIAPVSSTGQALQGRAPGLTVIANSGQPGSAPVIRIRGTGSVNRVQPYIIVDGVPGNLNNLNPNDIASIEVLKDASATAIYGSNGANGVIVVTTKKGKEGRFKININTSTGTRNRIKELDILNSQDYATLINEGLANDGDAPRFTDEQIEGFNTFDWGGLNVQTGFFQNHQISLSGGTEKVNYFVSYGYINEEGFLKESDFDRHNLRINNEYKINDNIKFGHRITYSVDNQSTRRSFGAFLRDQSAINGYGWEPFLPFFDANGDFTVPGRTANHPLAEVQFDTNSAKRRAFGINAYLNVKFLKDFTFVSTYAPGFSTREINDFDPATSPTGDLAENGGIDRRVNQLESLVDRNVGYTWFNTLNYNKDIGRHTVNLLLGHEQQENQFFRTQAIGRDITDLVTFPTVDNDPDATGGSGRNENASFSLFSRLTYGFDDKYLVIGTIRRDASSVFGPNSRYGTFPAISGLWNIHNESFMKNVSFLNQLKFRAGYGEVGNRNFNGLGFLNRLVVDQDYIFGGVGVEGASARAAANPFLQWESSKSTNFGVDIGFLNAFNLTVDYFDKDTADTIILVPPLTQTGGLPGSTLRNIGEINNKGWEFTLSYKKRFGDFGFGATAYVDMIDNEVKVIDRESGFLAEGNVFNNRGFIRTEAGFPIGYFFGLETNGIYQTQQEIDADPAAANGVVPGDLRYVDQLTVDTNNDGVPDAGDGVINDDDRTQIGSPHADFNYSLNLEFDYKGFDLSIFFQGVHGNEIFSSLPFFFQSELSSNFHVSALDRWTGPGTSNTVPRLSNQRNVHNTQVSDRFIYDGSYLKLRTIQLGYTIPQVINDKIGLDRLRVYVTGQNLVTWDSYDIGLDPELGTTGNSRTLGLDRGNYAQPKSLIFGINLTL